MSGPQGNKADKRMPDSVWIWRDNFGLLFYGDKRPERIECIEYMRVLSRQEVEKISGEGIDVQQYLNSLLRQIEGQKRHIATLTRKVEELENPSAHVAAGVTGHD